MALITIQLDTTDPGDQKVLKTWGLSAGSAYSKDATADSPRASAAASPASNGDSTDSKPDKPKRKRRTKAEIAADKGGATAVTSSTPTPKNSSVPTATDADIAKETRRVMLAAAKATQDSELILGILAEVGGNKRLEKCDPETYPALKARFEEELAAAQLCGGGE